MSRTRYKVTYECDCGMDYGSCGKRSVFLMEYASGMTTDIGIIAWKSHADDPESKLRILGYFSDADMSALSKLIDIPKSVESWDETDLNEFKEIKSSPTTNNNPSKKMEEITIKDEYGTRIYASSIETMSTIEIGVIGDYTAGVVTKEQARTLGEWLIKSSEEETK